MEHCQICKKGFLTVYDIPDKIWKKISPEKSESGALCIECADKRARKLGIDLFWVSKENEYEKGSNISKKLKESLKLRKSKYIKRWKGKDGQWHYSYSLKEAKRIRDEKKVEAKDKKDIKSKLNKEEISFLKKMKTELRRDRYGVLFRTIGIKLQDVKKKLPNVYKYFLLDHLKSTGVGVLNKEGEEKFKRFIKGSNMQSEDIERGKEGKAPKEYREEGATKRSQYADPKRFKYPVHTKSNALAALRYFSKTKNRGGYSSEEVKTIARRIISACKKYGVEVSEDAYKTFGLKKSMSLKEALELRKSR